MSHVRWWVTLLFTAAVFGQPRPIDPYEQAYWKARREGRYSDAAGNREQARALLAQLPVDAPPFATWVSCVSQLYEYSGVPARGREVIEAALARSRRLEDAHPSRIHLMLMLAASWQEDRSLIKAVRVLEQVASILEAIPPSATAPADVALAQGPSLSSVYRWLAELYQQLGWQEQLAATIVKSDRLSLSPNGSVRMPGPLTPSQSISLRDYLAVALGHHGTDDSRPASDSRKLAGTQQEEQLAHRLLDEVNRTTAQHNTERGFTLALQAIDAAPRAADREQLAELVSRFADSFPSESRAKTERLYQSLLSLAESWSDGNLQMALSVARNYAYFLATRHANQVDFEAANGRYRQLIETAHGKDSGHLDEPLKMVLLYEDRSPERALVAAQSLVAFEESVNGNTSQIYLDALYKLAAQYEMAKDSSRLLPLARQIITIGDLCYSPDDELRVAARANLAFDLARLQRFDEAEQLMLDAIAIAEKINPSLKEVYEMRLDALRRMRAGR